MNAWKRSAAVACLAVAAGAAAQTTPPANAPQPAAASASAAPDAAATPRQLAIANKAWTGDFDKMLERRMIRIYAPFSRSLYFNDKGRERGLAVELARVW